jgi:hypothetical protein
VRAKDPVLIEYWSQGDQRQVHLMNYAREVQEISVQFAKPVRAEVLSLDTGPNQTLEGETLNFKLDIYSILLLK